MTGNWLGNCRCKVGEVEPATMRAWCGMVNKMRGDIQSWTVRQSKHASYGWPLATLLTCLLDDQGFLANIDSLVDNLHRQLKVGSCLECCSLFASA